MALTAIYPSTIIGYVDRGCREAGVEVGGDGW